MRRSRAVSTVVAAAMLLALLPALARAQCAAPINLQAENGACGVRLTWQNVPGASQAAFWEILRNITNSTAGATSIASIAGSTLAYTDTSAQPLVPYFYFVRASIVFPPCPSGAVSDIVPGQRLPGVIPSVTAQISGCSRVTITWPILPDATVYRILRQPAGGASVPVAETTSTSLADSTGTPGVRYFYRVEPTIPCGTGGLGGVAEIVFPGPPAPGTPVASIVAESNTSASIQFDIDTFGLGASTEVFKDDVPLPLDARISLSGQTLTFNPAKIQDIGTYTLRVNSTDCTGSASQSAVLAVKPRCRTDFDDNGARNLDDVFMFLNAWFAGCP